MKITLDKEIVIAPEVRTLEVTIRRVAVDYKSESVGVYTNAGYFVIFEGDDYKAVCDGTIVLTDAVVSAKVAEVLSV